MANVLIVEDDAVTSSILARAIERAGHEVEIAKNGLQAIELLEVGPVELLVTDLMMPRLTGRELCERLRSEARYRTLPILLTTGAVDSDQLSWVEPLEEIEVFPKPIRVAELVDRIGELTSG